MKSIIYTHIHIYTHTKKNRPKEGGKIIININIISQIFKTKINNILKLTLQKKIK